MTEINVTVRGASAVARLSGALTEKAVGIKAEFVFDNAWDGLSKIIVFRSGGNATKGIEIDGSATVPWELLTPGDILSVGIVGRSQDGKVVIPTVWADCGMVKPSAAGVEPGDPKPEPSPDVVDQINQKADEAYRKAEEAIEKVENFTPGCDPGEGEPGKDGGYYTPSVDDDGNLTWTASKPNMPEIPGSNIQGPQGEQGNPGQPGPQGPQGDKGDDYVLTEADKREIAEMAAELVDIPQGSTGTSYNEETGELTISGSNVSYNEATGELTI